KRPCSPIEEQLRMPGPALASISPDMQSVLFYSPILYPPLSRLMKPALHLAGVAIDTEANAPQCPLLYSCLLLRRSDDATPLEIPLPPESGVSHVVWSPNSSHIALAVVQPDGVRLWIYRCEDQTVLRVPEVR